MSTKLKSDDDEKYAKYLEEYKKFYSLKRKYTLNRESIKNKLINSDNTLDVKKKLFSKQKFKCVNCGNEGGTLFVENSKFLKASCGNIMKPCDLNIELNKLENVNVYDQLIQTQAVLNATKKNVIVTKLDYLFKYIEEDKAVEEFDTYKEKLNEYQEKYNELLVLYHSIVNNDDQENIIVDKLLEHHNLVNEYKEYIDLYNKTSDINYLKDALSMHITQIIDLDKFIRETKYKYNMIEKDSDTNIITLYQDKYKQSDLELHK